MFMVLQMLDLFLVMLKHLKLLTLYDTATSVRGTEQSTVGTTVLTQIGRAKSRGFEYVSGTETNDIYAS